tara:strand:+ start:44 stop:265 length:222 start_codon:yes stop_codon:yes gene_type:complete
MNLTEIIFNQNMLKIFSTMKETYEEKEKEVKKYIGGMDATTFWGIVTIILITLIIFPLGLIYGFGEQDKSSGD